MLASRFRILDYEQERIKIERTKLQYLIAHIKQRNFELIYYEDYPFHIAAKFQQIEVMKELISTNLIGKNKINDKNENGLTVFLTSSLFNCYSSLSFLYNSKLFMYIDINAIDDFGRNAFLLSLNNNSYLFFTEEANSSSSLSSSSSSLFMNDNYKTIEYLGDVIRVNVHHVDYKNRNAYHCFIEENLCDQEMIRKKFNAKFLKNRINLFDDYIQRIFHYFYKKRININQMNMNGLTPLFRILQLSGINYHSLKFKIVHLMINLGACIHYLLNRKSIFQFFTYLFNFQIFQLIVLRSFDLHDDDCQSCFHSNKKQLQNKNNNNDDDDDDDDDDEDNNMFCKTHVINNYICDINESGNNDNVTKWKNEFYFRIILCRSPLLEYKYNGKNIIDSIFGELEDNDLKDKAAICNFLSHFKKS